MTVEQRARFDELGAKADEAFMANSDFVPQEWLKEVEAKEYTELLDEFLKEMNG